MRMSAYRSRVSRAVICPAYVPHVGVNDRPKVIRRRAWDKMVHEFFTNWSRVSNKTYAYVGDLNVVHSDEDLVFIIEQKLFP